jgi:hypothetical protein
MHKNNMAINVGTKESVMESDVETAWKDVHLHNDMIDTVSWNSVSVKIHGKKRRGDKHLLHSIDGDVSAG